MKKNMNTILESEIRQVLLEKENEVTASEVLKSKIDRDIRLKESKGVKKMKILNAKKIALATLAFAVITCSVCFAASKITYYVGSSNPNNDVSNYSDLDKVMKKLDFDTNVIKEFDNGYQFKSAGITSSKGMDANDNEVSSFNKLNISYSLTGKNDIFLYITQSKNIDTEEETKSYEAIQLGDTTVYYQQMQYKLVPVDYEITEEDQANMDAGVLQISYGSDTVEETLFTFVTWDQNGLNYLLMDSASSLAKDDYLSMAEELIQSR